MILITFRKCVLEKFLKQMRGDGEGSSKAEREDRHVIWQLGLILQARTR